MARLSAAAGEGRLTLAEADDRTGRVYAARTYSEPEVLVADLPSAERRHRSVVVDSTGLTLSLLALAGGVVWIPLFAQLEFGALPGVAGVVFGLFGFVQALTLFRAVSVLGLIGGSLGVALQVAWIAFHALMYVKELILSR